jgi:peroxisomal coenzyme A diphosphatase NUDT7
MVVVLLNLDDLKKISGRTPRILGSEHFTKFSILLPLIEIEGETHVLFEVRSLTMRRQPGEICFPGGKVDRDDQSEKSAAIRETCEELGINRASIGDLIPLDYIVSPFGTIIYPFVAVIDPTVNFKPNPTEVEEIFTTPLSKLIEKEPDLFNVAYKVEPSTDFPFQDIPGGENYNWQARDMKEHFYYFEDRVIWGLTARILQHFIELVSKK